MSSICAVRGEDISLDDGTIRTVGKGDKLRVFPLHPVIRELAESMPREGWWFPARQGAEGHIKPGAVSDLIHNAKLRAGITDPRLTAHSLRHSFGSELVEQGVDIRVVQVLMAHESIETTQIYTSVSGRRRRAGIEALAALNIPNRAGRRPNPVTI